MPVSWCVNVNICRRIRVCCVSIDGMQAMALYERVCGSAFVCTCILYIVCVCVLMCVCILSVNLREKVCNGLHWQPASAMLSITPKSEAEAEAEVGQWNCQMKQW